MLVAQSLSAIAYIAGYYFNGDASSLEHEFYGIKGNWQYGQKLTTEQARKFLEFNRKMRRMYDETGIAYAESFDEQFRPLIG